MTRPLTTCLLAFATAVLPCALNAAEPAPARTTSTPPPRTLDLRAPDIGRIFTPDQIDQVLSRAVDPQLEFVEVQALRLGDLPAEDKSASNAERFARTVTWLFAPSTTFAANERSAPDATYPLRPKPYMEWNYHASFPQPLSQP